VNNHQTIKIIPLNSTHDLRNQYVDAVLEMHKTGKINALNTYMELYGDYRDESEKSDHEFIRRCATLDSGDIGSPEDLAFYEAFQNYLEIKSGVAAADVNADRVADEVSCPDKVNQQLSSFSLRTRTKLNEEQEFDRLAFVNDWDDKAVISLLKSFVRENGLAGEFLKHANEIHEAQILTVLRGSDPAMDKRIAEVFGSSLDSSQASGTKRECNLPIFDVSGDEIGRVRFVADELATQANIEALNSVVECMVRGNIGDGIDGVIASAVLDDIDGIAEVKKASWSLIKNFPLNRFEQISDLKDRFLVACAEAEEAGDAGRYDVMIGHEITKPIVVLEAEGKLIIWDGDFQIGAAAYNGQTTIPALVGTAMPEPKLENARTRSDDHSLGM